MNLQELIDDYLEGKLSPKDQKLFEDLIADNPAYKIELERQEKGKAALELVEKRSHRLPPNLRSWLFSGIIAFFLVLAGYLLWVTLAMNPGEKLYAKYYETSPREAQTNAPNGNASGPLSEAFKAYDDRDFKKAAALFEQVESHNYSDYIRLYYGICQLELGRPEKAIPLFSRIAVGSNTASKEVASWYEALGYFKLNMLEQGKKPLKITAEKPNPFQDEAKKILETLK